VRIAKPLQDTEIKLTVDVRLARSEEEMKQAWFLTQLAYENFASGGAEEKGFFVSKIPWSQYQSLFRSSSSSIAGSPLHVCVAVLNSGPDAGRVVAFTLYADGSHCVFDRADPATHGYELRDLWRRALEQAYPGERLCVMYQLAVDPAYSGLGVAWQMFAFTHAAARGWGARFVIGTTVDDSLLAQRASNSSSGSRRAAALARRGVRFAVNHASPVGLTRLGYVALARDLVYSTWKEDSDDASQSEPEPGFLQHAWVLWVMPTQPDKFPLISVKVPDENRVESLR
jgi:GNAT superfamily N-acetyltransferase